MRKPLAATIALFALASLQTVLADDAIIRRANPTFPISNSVTVPGNAQLVFLSGTLADVADDKAPAGSIERLGDTATQAHSVLGKIAQELATAGLTMGDVVKMNVFLVGDPRKGGAMDFEGLMQAYQKVYGPGPNARNLPARTTVQVAGLPIPGALVEIEVVAASR